MSELDILQQELDSLIVRVAQISATVNALPLLYCKSEESASPHWIDCPSSPGSRIVRYKCSNCGYVATFKVPTCRVCKTKML